MRSKLMWLLMMVAICVLASCGNSDYCKVTEIIVDGDIVKHDNVKLSSLTSSVDSKNTTEAKEDNPITYSVLNNTDNFDISIRVDNPTDNSIAQLKFEVEGNVWIKNEKGEMAPFEDYNHGIVNWTSQNASRETFTFKTEAAAIVKIVGIKLVGETEWQTDNLGYNQLNIYKVDNIVDFVSNEYNVGYKFKIKSIEGVNVTSILDGETEIIPVDSVYQMEKNGNIVIDYDLKINDDLTLYCEQSKTIEVVDITMGEFYQDSNMFKVIIIVNNIGTDNKNITFEYTDGERTRSFCELANCYAIKEYSGDIAKISVVFKYYDEYNNIISTNSIKASKNS